MTLPPNILTVLLVSNHDRLAFVLQREIRSHGHHVTISTSGKEAIALAGKSHHDLVLMDTTLKGEKALSIAGTLFASTGVTILMLAGSAKEITLARSSGADIRGYLLKPFDTPQLWSAIRDALDARSTSRGEVSLISTAYEQDVLDDAVCMAAQIAMERANCSRIAAFERVAGLAACRAEGLRKTMGAAA